MSGKHKLRWEPLSHAAQEFVIRTLTKDPAGARRHDRLLGRRA
jgi:hypothetical protein